MDADRGRDRARADPRPRRRAPHGLLDVRAQPVGGRRAVPRLPARATRSRRTPRTAPSSRATTTALPVDEGDLLVDMNDFVGSVDRESLQVVVKELGADVRRHRTRAADAAGQRLDVRARGLGPHRRDRPAAAQRADGAADPERPEGEHPQLRQRPQHAHPGAARQRRAICASVLDGTPGDRPRGRRAAEGPRADAADPAQRPGLGRPGRLAATCPASSSSWSPTRR